MAFVGIVRAVNGLKGFGFLGCKETYTLYESDVFLHKFLVGIDKFNALRKGEVVAFTITINPRTGTPCVSSCWNDRLNKAEENGTLKDLAMANYTPPYPPNLEVGAKRTEQDINMVRLAIGQPIISALPDGQIVLVCPSDAAKFTERETGRHVAFTPEMQMAIFGQVREKRGSDALQYTNPEFKTMDERKSKHIIGGIFEPNPGLDGSLPTFMGILKAPVNDNGYGFIASPDCTTKYGCDAWLHRKNCPWVEYMDLEKGDRVLFQVELNERNQPAVMRIIKFKKDI
jgi:cold shock CspA family protein